MEKPHKKLDAWQEAVGLSIAVYQVTDSFPKEHRFALTDQLRRAALSIASNIAEGAARQTKKEFANYLHIARASLSELDTQLEIALKLTILDQETWTKLDARMNRVDRLVSGLIRHIKSGKPTLLVPDHSPLPLHHSPLTPS